MSLAEANSIQPDIIHGVFSNASGEFMCAPNKSTRHGTEADDETLDSLPSDETKATKKDHYWG